MRDKEEDSLLGSKGGFTVIEMLIALTLLVAAMIPLAIVLSSGFRNAVSSETRMHAREVAASEIDRIKSMKFEAVGLQGATATFATAGDNEQIKPDIGSGLAPTSTVTTPSGNTYTVTRDIRKVVKQYGIGSRDAYTKRIIITVSWQQPQPSGSEEVSTDIGPTEMSP